MLYRITVKIPVKVIILAEVLCWNNFEKMGRGGVPWPSAIGLAKSSMWERKYISDVDGKYQIAVRRALGPHQDKSVFFEAIELKWSKSWTDNR